MPIVSEGLHSPIVGYVLLDVILKALIEYTTDSADNAGAEVVNSFESFHRSGNNIRCYISDSVSGSHEKVLIFYFVFFV